MAKKEIGPALKREAEGVGVSCNAPVIPNPFPSKPAIRAEITGSDHCEALGVVAISSSPVLSLCRMLVAAGHDPQLALEAFRGDLLCLSIRSIGAGARLKINGPGTGFCMRRDVSTAPPARFSGSPYADSPPPSRRAA